MREVREIAQEVLAAVEQVLRTPVTRDSAQGGA
jgi:hypothetical protein